MSGGPLANTALDVYDKGRWAVVAVTGDVDVTTAHSLRSCLLELAIDGRCWIVVDFRETTFLDSTGLSALVGGLKRVRLGGGEIHLVVTASRIRKLFEYTRLERVFPIYETVEDASTE